MRGLVLALVIFGTIPFIFARPYLGLLVWSWIGYMNPHRLTYGFAFSFPWVLLIAVVTLLSLAASNENKKIPLSAFSVLLCLFLAWTGFTTIFAVAHSAPDGFERFAKNIVLVFVTLMLVRTRKRMDWLVWVIVLSLGFWGLKGGVFTVLKGGNYRVFGPPRSFFTDNNSFALAMCMTIPLMRYLQLQTKKKILKIGLGVLMLFTCISVLGTYSRGGLIALVIVGGALLLKTRRRIVIVPALIVVGVMAYQFMPSQWLARMDTLHHARTTDSAETRIQSWKFAINVAIHHPLTGGGFNDYQDPTEWQTYAPPDAIRRAVHSIYFRILGEQGFVGLALFLGLLAASWMNCRRVRRKTRDSSEQKWAFDLASMLQVALVAYMVAGAALPMSYFDLSYQLMALCALLVILVPQPADQRSKGRHSSRLRVLGQSPQTRHAASE